MLKHFQTLLFRFTGITTLFLGYIFFVFSHLTVKLASQFLPTHEIILFRFLFPPFFLLPLFLLKKIHFTFKQPYLLMFRAVVGCFAMYFYFLSLQSGNLGKMMLLSNLSVIWALVLSMIILKEMPNSRQILAIPIAFIAVYLIINPTGMWEFGKPEIYAIASSFCTAWVTLSLKKLREDHNTFSIMFVFFTVSTVIFAIPNVQNFIKPSIWGWVLLLLVGMFGFLAHFLMTISYKYTTVTIAASMSLTAIPMSYLLGIYFFSEQVTLKAGCGILLFCIAIYMIILKNRIA